MDLWLPKMKDLLRNVGTSAMFYVTHIRQKILLKISTVSIKCTNREVQSFGGLSMSFKVFFIRLQNVLNIAAISKTTFATWFNWRIKYIARSKLKHVIHQRGKLDMQTQSWHLTGIIPFPAQMLTKYIN